MFGLAYCIIPFSFLYAFYLFLFIYFLNVFNLFIYLFIYFSGVEGWHFREAQKPQTGLQLDDKHPGQYDEHFCICSC